MRFISLIVFSAGLLLLSACGGGGGGGGASVVSAQSTVPAVSSSTTSLLASSSSSSSSIGSQSSSSVKSAASSQALILPTALSDKLFSRSIDRVTSTLPSGTHKEVGVLQLHYGNNSTLLGDNLMLKGTTTFGTYSATYDSLAKTIQVKNQLYTPDLVEVVDTYTFVTATEGVWTQDYGKGIVLLEGKFSLADKEYPGYAPLSFFGKKAAITFLKTVTNLPSGTYIDKGTAVHLYQTETAFTTDGAGVGISNAEGTYIYSRPALNMARDKGFNKTFNAGYQIDFEFTTLTTGNFKENWNDGQILWEGTFELTSI